MMRKNTRKNVLIVDKQEFWRKLSFEALSSVGYEVSVCDSYAELKENRQTIKDTTDLVIIGCARTGVEEFELIEMIRQSRIKQLVLCTFLTRDEMRLIFQTGANDVAEKPFSPVNLIKIVKESFHGFAVREKYALKQMSEII